MRTSSPIILLCLYAILLLSCRDGGTSPPSSATQRDIGEPLCLQTDSFSASVTSENGHFSVIIDYPLSGPPAGVKSVRSYIKRLLFEHQTMSVPDSPAIMVHEYVSRREAYYTKALSQMSISDVDSEEAPEEGYEIRYLCGNERWATYEIYHYSYFTGAPHGEYTEYGVTFRLSDGRLLSTSDLLKPVDGSLYALMREGMKTYFKVGSDAELERICHVDLSLYPMPTFGPYLVSDGIRFHYSIYDVCPFDWGDPSFTIPYNKIKPYLTDTALDILGL